MDAIAAYRSADPYNGAPEAELTNDELEAINILKLAENILWRAYSELDRLPDVPLGCTKIDTPVDAKKRIVDEIIIPLRLSRNIIAAFEARE